MSKKLVSYIFPIYNESENINILWATVSGLLAKNSKYIYEIIFVNDGSRDNSLEKLVALQSSDKRITVVDFARNYGHQIAVSAGVDYASGDAIIIMDSDMQDPPQVSFELLNKWEEGYDVVYAQRRTRKDTLFKRLSANLFYRFLKQFADIDIPRNTGDFRLIDKQVANELRRFKEHNRFLRGMISYIGFKQTAVLFDRDERHAGTTGYPLKKMIRFAADGIFSFSSTPLKLISRTGYIIAGFSFIGTLYAITVKFFDSSVVVPGWTFIVSSVLFIGGIQLIMLGVLGGYIGRIYNEVQGRPLYGVRSVYSFNSTTRKEHLE